MPHQVRHDVYFRGVIQNEVKDPGNISLWINKKNKFNKNLKNKNLFHNLESDTLLLEKKNEEINIFINYITKH
jgi:hypothetical protein